MNEEAKPDYDTPKHERLPPKDSFMPLRPEDPHNKYSFSSYHMNIISGNKEVQNMPSIPPQYPPPAPEYLNYYPGTAFPAPGPMHPNDFYTLLNNLYLALSNQSKLLSYLVEKNEQSIKTTSQIYQEIINKRKSEQAELNGSIYRNTFKANPNTSSDITANDLVSILYGNKTTFKYKLTLDREYPLEKTLYRERNFKLKINLLDEKDNIVPNSNKIPVSLALYTAENPPKFLESNTLGNKLLKGYTQQDLLNGIVSFDKIQIKQVTSHYRKGMLFLVAFTKMPTLGSIKDEMAVDYQQIRPLVIDKVIVKAKRVKESNGGSSTKDGTEANNRETERDSQKILMNESQN